MYLTRRFYILATAVILLIGGGYYYAPLYHAGLLALRLFGVLVLADIALLYFRSGITAERHCPDRFSNGDDNEVDLRVESTYPFGIRLNVTDEIPFVFQRRAHRHRFDHAVALDEDGVENFLLGIWVQ